MTFTIGQTVGDYRIIEVIGSGGMGTVYKVQHLISDRIEAIKVILPDLIGTSELADRFVREIRVQARLSHPNIASLLNAFRLENQLLMVMEYVDGTTLHARLRHGGIEPAESVEIVLQVLSALAYAHSQGVVHRDIKPANIVLTNSGIAKLMDFGIARSLSDKQLTQTGAAVGSVYYMSPEQVQGAPVDGRSDLYSLGIVLYEMVTGARPITGDSSWAVMNAHLNQIPRSPATLNANLPALLSLAILKAIEKKPADRFQSASEFSELLNGVRNRYAPSSSQALREKADLPVPSPEAQGTPPAAQPIPPTIVATPNPQAQPTPTPPGNTSASQNLKRFEADQLERVKRDLAVYVGPIARILVDRAVKKATNVQQLYEVLSAEIPAGEERKRFLATRPR